MKTALTALIKSKTKSEFLKNYRDNTPMVSHDLGEAISEITELPFLK